MFKILLKDDLWYNILVKNTSNLTINLNNETLEKIQVKRLKKISEKVIHRNYKFGSTKKIIILENKTVKLLLTNEKIIHQLIRMLLKTAYEYSILQQNVNLYQTTNEHFRSNFQDINWVIKSKIEGIDLPFNNQQLNIILSKKIQDFRFINLISKLLQFEILVCKKWDKSSLYISQSQNTLLPITINIYYKEWDKWIQKIILNQLLVNYQNKNSQQSYYKIDQTIEQIKKLNKRSHYYNVLLKELKIFKRKQANILNLVIKHIKIEYIRYAYNWILGISENKKFLNQIKIQIMNFILVNLKYQVMKIQIINLYRDKLNCFGYSIFYLQNTSIRLSRNIFTYKKILQTKSKLKFDITTNVIIEKIAIKYCTKISIKNYYSIDKNNIVALKRKMIIKYFIKRL